MVENNSRFLLTSSKPLGQPQLILPQACQTPSPRQGDTTLALPSNTRAVCLFLPFFHQGKKILERSYFGYLPHLLVHFQLHSFKRLGGGERSGTRACRTVDGMRMGLGAHAQGSVVLSPLLLQLLPGPLTRVHYLNIPWRHPSLQCWSPCSARPHPKCTLACDSYFHSYSLAFWLTLLGPVGSSVC